MSIILNQRTNQENNDYHMIINENIFATEKRYLLRVSNTWGIQLQ